MTTFRPFSRVKLSGLKTTAAAFQTLALVKIMIAAKAKPNL
jgi:hypothetical protein